LDVITQFGSHTDAFESPTRRRRWNSAVDHQLPQERTGFRLNNRRLRANPNQAVGVADPVRAE